MRTTRDPLERLLRLTDRRRGPNRCWPWKGYVNPGGYGTFRMPEGTRSAHRSAYRLLVGPIPDGMEIDHRCRRRDCVNPHHLEPVPHVVNANRGLMGSRLFCRNGHSMDANNTGARADGRRYCMICHRERERARRAAHAAKLGH